MKRVRLHRGLRHYWGLLAVVEGCLDGAWTALGGE